MSRDVNSEEIGTDTRVKERAMVKYAKQILDPRQLYGNWIPLMLCVTSISIDPLFFYIPVIRNSICLNLDTGLGIIAFVLRSAVDLIYMICVYFPRQNHVDNSERTRVDDSALYGRLFGAYRAYIDLLAVLPLPQVAIITIVLIKRYMNYYHAMNVLKYFVFFQFVPKVIRIYPLLKEATGTFDILGEVTWAKAAFNLYLYLLSGHAFGALWYFLAMHRVFKCWDTLKGLRINECVNSGLNITTYCSAKSDYDFGIYEAVFESNVAKGDFLLRFMYCLRWGVQSLSCFAENLQTSADTWENIFTISISIASLVLFVFLIGNMQLYIQSGTSRSEEAKLMLRETQKWIEKWLEKWQSLQLLPEKLQHQVKKHQLYVWRETKGVDVENILNNLPKDLRRNIKSAIGLELLKKVPNFLSISEQRLNAICERLKHVLYSDGIYIVRKNHPIDEMLFIVRGKLLINDNDNNENFEKCQSDFCGDELSMWAQDLPSSPNLPISNKNIKTATGGVEAFALTADDLKDVFTRFK